MKRTVRITPYLFGQVFASFGVFCMFAIFFIAAYMIL
jgi:hypothetical protein